MIASTRETSPKKNKRASLIVPINGKSSFEQPRGVPTRSSPTRRESVASTTTTTSTFVSTESDYFTALAAQERRVLELKEQLSKAEVELQKLKKQWANHESAKRRDERARLHHMKPMAASPKVNRDEDEDGSNAWMYEEMARRKALLNNTKTSHRRVFSGSRQTKALSLLETIETEEGEQADQSVSPGPSKSIRASPRVNAEVRRSRELVKRNTLMPPRASTTPNLWQTGDLMLDPMAWARADSRSPQREAILRTGKQVATDLREGLWTFLEDLRQVAIGDEPRPAQDTAQALRRSNKSQANRSARPSKAPTDDPEHLTRDYDEAWQDEDAGETFAKEHGLPVPTLITPAIVRPARNSGSNTPIKSRQGRPLQAALPISDFESWETWDSPPPTKPASLLQQQSESPGTSTLSTTSASSTPGTAISEHHQHIVTSNESTPKQRPSVSKRDGIPWPDLNKLGPPAAALRRTASHMMQEWERSLSPSPVTSPAEGETKEMDFLASGQDVLH